MNHEWDTIFQVIGHPAMILDSGHRILAANEVVLRITGKTIEELQKMKCWEVFHGTKAQRPPPECPFEQMLTSGSTETGEMECEAFGGTYLVSCTPILNNKGKPERVIHIAMDITRRKQAETVLGERDETIRALMNSPVDTVVLLDKNGIILNANETLAQRLGRPVDELEGMCVYDLLPPELAKSRRARIEEVGRTGEPVRFEDQLAGRWFDNSLHPISDSQGSVLKIAILARDITEYKLIEEALRQKEANLSALIENSEDRIWAVDTQYRLIIGNTPFHQSVTAAFGRNFVQGECVLLDRIPATVRHDWQGYYDRALRGERFGIEVAAQFTPGNHFMDYRFSPIKVSGQIVGVVVTGRNITNRKRAKEALRESELKYRMMVENARDVVLRLTTDGILTYCSPAVTAFSGYEAEEEIGEHIRKYFADPVQFKQTLALMSELIEKRESRSAEFLFRPKNRAPFWVEVVGNPIVENNQVTAVHCIMRDITRRKQAEETLKDQYSILKGVIESTDSAVFSLDRNYCYTRFNSHHAMIMKKLYGAEIELGRSIFDYQSVQEDKNKAKFNLDRALGGEQFTDEAYSGEKGRLRRFFEVTHTPIKDTDKTIIGVAVFAKDITERKQAEEELQKTVLFLTSMIEQSPMPMWISDDKGTLIKLNKACCDLLNITEDDVVGKYNVLKDNIVEEQGLLPLVQSVFEKGQTVRFEIKYDSSQLKHLDLKRTAFVILNVTIFPIKDADGRITNAVIQHIDITERKQAEEALRESEERFRKIYTYAGFGIAIIDASSLRFRNANEKFCQFLGYSEEELRNLSFRDLTHPDDLAASIESTSQLLSDRIPTFSMEKRYLKKDGTVVWGALTVTHVKNANGSPGLTVVIIADITDRKKAEDALAEEAIRRRILIEQSGDGIVVLDQDGKVYEANQRYADMLGYSAEEVRQLHVWDWDTQWTREQLLEMIRLVDAAGDHFETSHRRKDGTFLDVEISTNGAVCAGRKLVFCVCRDISQRKRAEEALRESERKLKTLFDLLPVGVSILDAERNIAKTNPAIERILDISKEGLLKGDFNNRTYLRPDGTLMPAEEFASVRAIKEQRAVRNVETGIVKEDGKVIWTNVNAVPVGFSDWKVIVVTSDITERKQSEIARDSLMQELAQKNTELEQFTYTVSHDLRSPLITIRGFLGLLKKDIESENKARVHEDIGRISAATGKMEQLLTTLLELSRIGRIINPPVHVSVKILAKEAEELMAIPLRNRGVTLTIADDLPEVYGDRARLLEVMTNLIENAVKFMGGQKEPGIEIGVRYTGNEQIIFVKDNGIGIEPENQSRIFSLFERLNTAIPGTGIGLALVRRIVEIHGGRIWVESEGAGAGSMFCFTLPGVPQEKGKD